MPIKQKEIQNKMNNKTNFDEVPIKSKQIQMNNNFDEVPIRPKQNQNNNIINNNNSNKNQMEKK